LVPTQVQDADAMKIKIDYRPRDLTHRCQGCGEWLTEQEAASHCRTGGIDRDGNPWPEACGPIDAVPRDDITIWLRDQDEVGCHEAADELDARRKRLSELADAGTGYSQQTVDALTKERDWLQQELTRLTDVETKLCQAREAWTKLRDFADRRLAMWPSPGGICHQMSRKLCAAMNRIERAVNSEEVFIPVGLVGQRDPEFPCTDFVPGEPSYGRCEGDGHYLCDQCIEYSTRLTAEPVDSGAKDSAPVDGDGDQI
jgi:hypothetical protein